MVQYGTTQKNMALIAAKAHSRKDGVYSCRGVLYRVQGGQITYCAYEGQVLLCCGCYLLLRGDCGPTQAEMRRALYSMGSN